MAVEPVPATSPPAAATSTGQRGPAAGVATGATGDATGDATTGAAARFWLKRFFWCARYTPWLLRVLKPVTVRLAVWCSGKIRRCTAANARRIFGPAISPREQRRFARGVVGQFYDFVIDVGRSIGLTADQLRDNIESVHGHDAYVARRRAGGGAVVVTIHMGPFEVGLAALTGVEPHIHVVFKRDPMSGFEIPRSALRAALGVHEAPIDDGWATWLALRDALLANHVVVMQGDRAMPGQKSQAVPMLGGHLLLPLGPLKLAQLTGSPLIPVFSVRAASGRCSVYAEPAIEVDPAAALVGGVHPALLQLGKAIEKFVAAHPEQWLVLDAAFVEDATKPSLPA